jgi:hypothetical protein
MLETDLEAPWFVTSRREGTREDTDKSSALLEARVAWFAATVPPPDRQPGPARFAFYVIHARARKNESSFA